MYCSNCGLQIEDHARYCLQCGQPTANAPTQAFAPREKPLTRAREDAKLGGVCAGVARYFDLDVSFVRILWCFLTIYPPGVGLIAYIICWIVMPQDPVTPPPHVDAVKSN